MPRRSWNLFFFFLRFYYFKPGEQFHKTCEKSKEVFNAEGPGPWGEGMRGMGPQQAAAVPRLALRSHA